jgi:hypothetical protein
MTLLSPAAFGGVRFTARKIFYKNDRVYLFGSDHKATEHKEIIGRVFHQTGGGLARRNRCPHT